MNAVGKFIGKCVIQAFQVHIRRYNMKSSYIWAKNFLQASGNRCIALGSSCWRNSAGIHNVNNPPMPSQHLEEAQTCLYNLDYKILLLYLVIDTLKFIINPIWNTIFRIRNAKITFSYSSFQCFLDFSKISWKLKTYNWIPNKNHWNVHNSTHIYWPTIMCKALCPVLKETDI